MAAAAAARTVEIGLARFRVARQQVLERIRIAVDHRLGALAQERCQILNLRVGQIERGHAAILTALADDRPDQAALLVIQHDFRAHQIRPVIVAAGVGSVAATALDHELLLPAFDGICGRNRPADLLGMRRPARERNRER
jgi:hypothetical protein